MYTLFKALAEEEIANGYCVHHVAIKSDSFPLNLVSANPTTQLNDFGRHSISGLSCMGNNGAGHVLPLATVGLEET